MPHANVFSFTEEITVVRCSRAFVGAPVTDGGGKLYDIETDDYRCSWDDPERCYQDVREFWTFPSGEVCIVGKTRVFATGGGVAARESPGGDRLSDGVAGPARRLTSHDADHGECKEEMDHEQAA